MSGQLIGDLLSVGGKVQEERDRLEVQLQESERLRKEAFQACETMRQELQAVTLERDEWKAAAEYQQQQATQLRLQVEALESTMKNVQGINKTLAEQVSELQRQTRLEQRTVAEWKDAWEKATAVAARYKQQVAELQAQLEAAKNEASKTGWVVVGSHLPNREQLDAEIVRLKNLVELEANQRRELQLQVAPLKVSLEDARRVAKSCEGELAIARHEWQHAQQQVAELQAQLDAIEREATHSEDADATANAIVARIHRFRHSACCEASKTGWVVVGSHLPDREQLDAEIVRLTNNWGREIDERKALQQQVSELQAQLDAAAVTPAQQPDGNAAERLEAVRRMIGEIWGWYACVERLGEQSAETWEQVGALLGHLQREAD